MSAPAAPPLCAFIRTALARFPELRDSKAAPADAPKKAALAEIQKNISRSARLNILNSGPKDLPLRLHQPGKKNAPMHSPDKAYTHQEFTKGMLRRGVDETTGKERIEDPVERVAYYCIATLVVEEIYDFFMFYTPGHTEELAALRLSPASYMLPTMVALNAMHKHVSTPERQKLWRDLTDPNYVFETPLPRRMIPDKAAPELQRIVPRYDLRWLVAFALGPAPVKPSRKKGPAGGRPISAQAPPPPPLRANAAAAPPEVVEQLAKFSSAVHALKPIGAVRELEIKGGLLIPPPEFRDLRPFVRRLSTTSLYPLLDAPSITSAILPSDLQTWIRCIENGTLPMSPHLQALPFAARVACAVPAQEAEAALAKMMERTNYLKLFNTDADLHANAVEMERDLYIQEDPQSPVLEAIRRMLVSHLVMERLCGVEEEDEDEEAA